MKLDNLDKAIQEAERFIEKAKVARESRQPSTYAPSIYYFRGLESSACKRSSMDLTRALSKLRQDTV